MNKPITSLKKHQDNSTVFQSKRYKINPLSYALSSFNPFIICMLTFKYDLWINRFSLQDRTFILKVYLRSFCQIAGVIYTDLCWSSNLEHIDSNHFHLHIVFFQDGLNPHRSDCYVNILDNLWTRILNLDDFSNERGLDRIVPTSDPDTRFRIQKNYNEGLRLYLLETQSSFPNRINLFSGDIVKNKTPYRFRDLTGMGKCIIKTYDQATFGKAGLFYNQKDQDQLSYCDFSPALIKKARLNCRFKAVNE